MGVTAAAACAEGRGAVPPAPMSNKRKAPDSCFPATPERRQKRTCSFGEVEVREYSILLAGGGGVPSEGGPPLGLGWDVVDNTKTSLAAYEQTRIGIRSPREVYMSEGYISAKKRSRILKEVGYTSKQIKRAARQVQQTMLARWELNTVKADNWLFDTSTPDAAAEVASDLGFESNEVQIFDATRWHQKAAILQDVSRKKVFPALSEEQPDQNCDDVKIWREVRRVARTWFSQGNRGSDCAFIIKSPPKPTGNAPHERAAGKAALKARSRISRFVDCLATSWQDLQEEDDGAAKVGSLAVILQGWDDSKLGVDWKHRVGGFYEVEELCI